MLNTRFWGSITMLLCALLLQDCQPGFVGATEEGEPAVSPSSASATHQHSSSDSLAAQALISLSTSFAVPAPLSCFSTLLASSKESLSAPTTMGSSPMAPCDVPAVAMLEALHAEPSSNKADHAPFSLEGSCVSLGNVEEVVSKISSGVAEDSKPSAKRRSPDLDDEVAKQNKKKYDGESEKPGCVGGDAPSTSSVMDGSGPDRATQLLEVMRPDTEENSCCPQTLGKEEKVSSPEVFSRCIPELRVSTEGEDKDTRLVALKTLGEMEWRYHFGEVDSVPDLPRDIDTILDSACPFWPDKRVGDTHLLVLIPATVDRVPFTLTRLWELTQRMDGVYETRYRYYSNAVRAQFGKKSHDRSYWLLMTRDVLEGSQCQTYATQVKLVASYVGDDGRPYEMPSALEAATAILMHYVCTGERLFGDSPWTYTCCQDLIDGKYPVLVGGFESSDLCVSYDIHDFSSLRGVSGCRKF